MTVGAVIGFLIWAAFVFSAIITQKDDETLNYGRCLVLLILISGSGAAIGYLVSLI